jgi:hypothetical protein
VVILRSTNLSRWAAPSYLSSPCFDYTPPYLGLATAKLSQLNLLKWEDRFSLLFRYLPLPLAGAGLLSYYLALIALALLSLSFRAMLFPSSFEGGGDRF